MASPDNSALWREHDRIRIALENAENNYKLFSFLAGMGGFVGTIVALGIAMENDLGTGALVAIAGWGVSIPSERRARLARLQNLGRSRRLSETECVLPFTLQAVPTATVYSIQVGERLPREYSYAQMVRWDWLASFAVG